jgi:hypothetical protein
MYFLLCRLGVPGIVTEPEAGSYQAMASAIAEAVAMEFALIRRNYHRTWIPRSHLDSDTRSYLMIVLLEPLLVKRGCYASFRLRHGVAHGDES